MPNQEVKIDFNKLENEVRRAVNADEKYWRENNAKLRAVEQRVPTYENFRQMVLASHLKPLDKGETIQSLQNKTNWNMLASGSKAEINTDEVKTQPVLNNNNQKVLTNLEFMQLWNKIPKNNITQKWTLIKSVSECFEHLFSTEINGEMLGQFLLIFENHLRIKDELNDFIKDCELVLKLLEHFPKCKRFDLNILFLGKSEIDACKNVFEQLRHTFENDNSKMTAIDTLQKIFLK